MNLEFHYNQLNSESLEALHEGRYHIDHLIDSPSDSRRGITLLIRQNEQIKANIQEFQSAIKEVEPYQYYYPSSDLHVTTLSIISCYDGFKLSQIDINQYIDLLTEELTNTRGFQIEFRGTTLSRSGILIKGFPNPTLNQIRDKLRTRFKKSEFQSSIDSRYQIKTAHCTVMRFRKQLQNIEELINKINQYENLSFGTLKVNSLELVYNDWYQKYSKTKTLKQITLIAA